MTIQRKDAILHALGQLSDKVIEHVLGLLQRNPVLQDVLAGKSLAEAREQQHLRHLAYVNGVSALERGLDPDPDDEDEDDEDDDDRPVEDDSEAEDGDEAAKDRFLTKIEGTFDEAAEMPAEVAESFAEFWGSFDPTSTEITQWEAKPGEEVRAVVHLTGRTHDTAAEAARAAMQQAVDPIPAIPNRIEVPACADDHERMGKVNPSPVNFEGVWYEAGELLWVGMNDPEEGEPLLGYLGVKRGGWNCIDGRLVVGTDGKTLYENW